MNAMESNADEAPPEMGGWTIHVGGSISVSGRRRTEEKTRRLDEERRHPLARARAWWSQIALVPARIRWWWRLSVVDRLRSRWTMAQRRRVYRLDQRP